MNVEFDIGSFFFFFFNLWELRHIGVDNWEIHEFKTSMRFESLIEV